MIRRLVAAMVAVVCLASAVIHAQSNPRVVLLEPIAPDALGTEVFARLRGELSAAGFEVMVVPVAADVEPRAALEDAGRQLGPAAVVILQRSMDRSSGEQIAELWISDLLLQRTLIQRGRVNPDKPSRDIARLAVQVAELLKARLAELSVEGERERPEPAAEPAAPVAPSFPPAAPPARELQPPVDQPPVVSTLALGVGMLQRFEGGGRAWTPLARVGVAFPDLLDPVLTFELRANAAGLGQIREYSAADGGAKWRQSFGTLEVAARFIPRSPVQPPLSLSSGAYLLEIAGQARSPYRAYGDTTWSALSSVGTGLWVELGGSFAWVIDAHLLATWSETSVRINEREVWSSHSPMGFVSTTVVGLF